MERQSAKLCRAERRGARWFLFFLLVWALWGAEVCLAQELSSDATNKLATLNHLKQDAYQASTPTARKKVLNDILRESAEFLVLAPWHTNIWAMRANTAVKLDYPGTGWLAGRKLKELNAANSNEPEIRDALKALEQKNWLGPHRLWRDWTKVAAVDIVASAVEGDLEAQYALGQCYCKGTDGFNRDLGEGVRWLQRAAGQSEASAQVELGLKFLNGVGMSQDDEQAF
jgi:TPR repeat protein